MFCSISSPVLPMVKLLTSLPFNSQVKAEKLRWAVGCIVSEGTESPSEDLLHVLRSKGWYDSISRVICSIYFILLNCQ